MGDHVELASAKIEILVTRALSRWARPGDEPRVLRPLEGGYRNAAYLVEIGGELRVAKTTRRSEAAIAWLAPVAVRAAEVGLTVPAPVPHRAGAHVARVGAAGVTLEPYLAGTPLADADRSDLAARLARLHAVTTGTPQRPGFASAADLLTVGAGGDVDLGRMPAALSARCRDAWEFLADRAATLIHGDATPGNAVALAEGGIGLFDWDEARVDAPLFDRAALGLPVSSEERRAALAWEVAVSWHVEPEHARSVARSLGWPVA